MRQALPAAHGRAARVAGCGVAGARGTKPPRGWGRRTDHIATQRDVTATERVPRKRREGGNETVTGLDKQTRSHGRGHGGRAAAGWGLGGAAGRAAAAARLRVGARRVSPSPSSPLARPPRESRH